MDMFRAAPVRTALVTVLPVALAFMQLANSLFNDLSFLVSAPFALTVVGFAYLLAQYTFTQFRRRQIEQSLQK